MEPDPVARSPRYSAWPRESRHHIRTATIGRSLCRPLLSTGYLAEGYRQPLPAPKRLRQKSVESNGRHRDRPMVDVGSWSQAAAMPSIAAIGQDGEFHYLSSMPACSNGRAKLFTGRYRSAPTSSPHWVIMIWLTSWLTRTKRLCQTCLGDEGYKSALFGKLVPGLCKSNNPYGYGMVKSPPAGQAGPTWTDSAQDAYFGHPSRTKAPVLARSHDRGGLSFHLILGDDLVAELANHFAPVGPG